MLAGWLEQRARNMELSEKVSQIAIIIMNHLVFEMRLLVLMLHFDSLTSVAFLIIYLLLYEWCLNVWYFLTGEVGIFSRNGCLSLHYCFMVVILPPLTMTTIIDYI